MSIADSIEQSDHALTVPELSKLLSLHRVTLYRMAQAGDLPCLRINSSVRFCPKTTAKWVRERGAL